MLFSTFVLLFTFAVHAEESLPTMTCKDPSDRSEQFTLQGSNTQHIGTTAFVLEGQLTSNFNGAKLVCRAFGWDALNQFQHPLVCAGVWNQTTGKTNERSSDQVVVVTITKDTSGAYSASYNVNYDLRAPKRSLVLPCEIK